MSKELEKALELPEGWLIELGFDVLDRPFRFVDSKSHLPTIKVVLPACEVDESSAWDLRDSVASLIGKLLASQQAEHPEQAEGALRCTCPSGNGSLQWPCHEHSGGAQGEREAFEAYRDRRNAQLESEGHKPGSKWHVTHAHYATWEAARAALAQPSPAPELERPEVVAHFKTPTRGSNSGVRFATNGPVPEGLNASLYTAEPLMTVAQYDRIVGALRAEIERLNIRIVAISGQLGAALGERDAALSRLAELDGQEPVAKVVWADTPSGISAELLPASERLNPGAKLYANPVAQAGQVPEEWRAALQRLEDACDKRSALFSAEAYRVAIQTPGFGDAMSDLDDAREAARDLLAAASAQGGDA